MPRAGCSRSPIAPNLIFKFQLHGFWCALSKAVTSLATVILQRVIFHHFPIFYFLNSARCFEVPAETHLLVHGMNKHVQFRDLLGLLQLFALWSRDTWQRLSLVVKCALGANQLEGIPCIG